MKIRTSRLSLLKLPPNQHMRQDIFGRNFVVKDSAPRAWEVELQEILSTITDPVLREKITTILQLARLGWLDQNQPVGADRGFKPQPQDLLNPTLGLNADLLNAPNQVGTMGNTGKYQSGMGPNIVDDRLPNPSGITTHPSANVNPNTDRPTFGSGYAGKKSRSYKGSLLLSKGSKFLIKSVNPSFQIQKSDHGTFLTGVVSSDIIDEQADSVSLPVLSNFMEKLKSRQVNLSYDHSRNVSSIIGFFFDGVIQKGADNLNYLIGTAKLNESHEATPHIIETINNGARLGLSIEGGEVEYKKTNFGRLITKCNLYKVSIVDTPACQVCHTMGVTQK